MGTAELHKSITNWCGLMVDMHLPIFEVQEILQRSGYAATDWTLTQLYNLLSSPNRFHTEVASHQKIEQVLVATIDVVYHAVGQESQIAEHTDKVLASLDYSQLDVFTAECLSLSSLLRRYLQQ